MSHVLQLSIRSVRSLLLIDSILKIFKHYMYVSPFHYGLLWSDDVKVFHKELCENLEY